MARKESPVAVLAPGIRSIKLYADGRIEYHGKSGSVIGATARIETSGEKYRIRDTRKMVLRIEGPRVAIAAPLPPAAFQLHRDAEEFVAQINAMSNGGDRRAPAPAPARPRTSDRPDHAARSSPAPAGAREADLQVMDLLIGQLERLGQLRASGVLTEDEFQEQKAALLRVTRTP